MLTGTKIKLRHKRLGDAQDDYVWQTDPELMRLDATFPLDISFPEYLSLYAGKLLSPAPNKMTFAIETPDHRHIGNCSCYNIDRERGDAELGILIGNRRYWDTGCGTEAVTMLVDHAFRETDINRIHLKTLVSNQRAQRCFRKCGFTPCGYRDKDGFKFMLMELYRPEPDRKPSEESRIKGGNIE